MDAPPPAISTRICAPPNRVITLAPRGTPLWHTTHHNFAPRAGAAYLLSPERGTTLRGGVGVFYDLGTGQAAQAFGSVFPYARERLLSDVAFPLGPGSAEPPPLNLDPPFGTVYAFTADGWFGRIVRFVTSAVRGSLSAAQIIAAMSSG